MSCSLLIRASLSLGLLGLVAASSAHAAPSHGPRPEPRFDADDFDLDGDGALDEREIRTWFARVEAERYWKSERRELKPPTEFAGAAGMSPVEEHAYLLHLLDATASLAALEEDVARRLAEFRSDLGDQRTRMPVDEVEQRYGGLARGPLLGRVRLRRSVEDFAPFQGPRRFADAEGALLSFTRNLLDDADLLHVRGAVLWPLERDEDAGGPLWVPSITFDRLKNDADSTKETSSLVFRMGWEWQGGDSARVDGWYARTNLAYATDFDLRSVQVAGEAEFQPVVQSWGIDTYKDLGLGFQARWRPTLRLETGYVFDDGGRAGLDDDELFLRLGGRLSAELRHDVAPLRGWTLRLDATLLEGFAGEPDENEMYEVRATRQLDDAGHLGLELGWRKGETLLVQDDVQTLTFGLSLKY